MRTDTGLTSANMPSIMVASRKKNRGTFYSRLFLTITLLMMGFAFSESAAQCVTPPSGLVSWWPGEGNASDIQDGNDGTLQNGTAFASGMVGQAFSFDGVDDVITVPASTNLGMTSAYTFGAWVNSIGSADLDRLIAARGDASAHDLDIKINRPLVGNTLQIVHNRTNGATTEAVLFAAPPLNQLFHFAVTFDGAEVRAYYNGVEAALVSATNTIAAPLYTNRGWLFGRTTHPDYGGLGRFVGILDEIEIYNRALSVSEIQSIYNAGSEGKCTNTPPPVCVNPPSGLVSWWPGDNNANDIQDGNNGSLQLGATFAPGKVGQALSLDGIDDFVLVPHNSNLTFGSGQDFTIDAWINLRNPVAGHDDWIVSKVDIQNVRTGATPNFYAFEIYRDTRVLRLDLHSNGTVYQLSGSSIPIGQWVHVTAVREGSMGLLYINGVLDASATLTAGTVSNSDPLAVGGVYDTFFNPPVQQSHVFGGLIDEFDIFNRALTASEIQSIYNAGSAGKCTSTPPPVCVNPPSDLVSWWPGDENANDIKGNNHGTLQNGATFAAGKVGQAFSFDGVDDAAHIADNSNLRVSSFTLDAWINTTDATLQQPIIAKTQASGNWVSYMLRIQEGGKLSLIVENSAENRSAHWRTLSTLSSNRWYHVAGTWQNLNGDNTDAKIYVDGVEQAIEISFNNGYSSTFLLGYTSEPLYIGRDEQPSGRFVGLIDEIGIYDRVLSASEIQSIYNAGSAGKCKDASTTEVTLRLLDQNGMLIPASQFVVAGETVLQGGTISLPAGPHAFRLFPGLNGSIQGSLLHRVETVSISGATQTVEFIWATAPLQVNIVDQSTVPIPASQFLIRSATTELPNGASVTLPVTDDPASSTISGTLEAGYIARLLPGLNGQMQGSLLYREDQIELGISGIIQNSTWVTAPLQVSIVDQNSAPIPASQFLIRSATTELANGTSVTLPVTDDPNTSTISGTLEAGYIARSLPGLNGQQQITLLYRDDQVELTATGLVGMFIWEVASGSLHVVDALENEVNGASINQPFLGTISTGTFVSLPVTDNNLYPGIASTYASGYSGFSIQTAPNNVFAGPFTFELLSNEIFDPAFVPIDGEQYGLRFNLQTPPDCVSPPSGLVSWWPGEDNADDIRSSNHGMLQNGATFAAGKVGQALSLDGMDDYVSVPDHTDWDFGMNDFTIDLWVQFDQIKHSMFIHQQSGSNFGGFEFDFQPPSGMLVFSRNGNDGGIARAWSPQPNTWYHLAVTRTSGTYRLYVNGAQQGSEEVDHLPVADVTGIVRIGNWAGSNLYNVDGLIDELDIFNSALSASEIQSIYNAGSAGKCKECVPPAVTFNLVGPFCVNAPVVDLSSAVSPPGGTFTGAGISGSLFDPAAAGAGTHLLTYTFTDVNNCTNSANQNVVVNAFMACVTPPSGLVSWWPGDGNADDIKDGNHGSLQNGATFASGKVGQAFSFDGVDDGINIVKSSNLEMGAGDFTIGAWINFTKDFPSQGHIIIFDNVAGVPFYRLFVQSDGEHAGLFFRDNSGNAVAAEGSTLLNDGTWHYVVGARSGQDGHLYVDGVLVATASNPSVGTITTSTCTYARIGATNTGPGHCTSTALTESYFKGRIDEVEIYNRALSAQEIADIYNAGSAGKCKVSLTFNPVGPFCVNAPAVDLSSFVSPPGGTFSGPGISGSAFTPSVEDIGTHVITYTLNDPDNCTFYTATQNITVHPLPTVTFNSVGPFSVTDAPVDLSGEVSLAGGTFSGPGISGSMFDPAEAGVGTHTITYTFADENTCSNSASQHVVVNEAAPVHNFIFLADKDVTLDRHGASEGNIHANNDIVVKKGAPSMLTGDLSAVDDIIIQAKNTVNGDATAGDAVSIKSGATVNGTVTENASVAIIPLPNPWFSTSGSNRIVPQNGSLALSAGSYRTVLIKRNGTLHLSNNGVSGDYYFNTLDTEVKAVLSIDVTNGPVTVNVVSKLNFNKEVKVQISSGEDGSSEVTFTTLQKSKLTIGEKARVLGEIIASRAEVILAKNSRFKGAITAEGIFVQQGAIFLPHGSSINLPSVMDEPDVEDVGVEEEVASTVTDYELSANYPNPFNPSTQIKFAMPEAGRVALKIFTETGQLVRTLVDGEMQAGHHVLGWNGRDQRGTLVASGIYFYQLVVQKSNGESAFTETKRMTLVK